MALGSLFYTETETVRVEAIFWHWQHQNEVHKGMWLLQLYPRATE